ncbi:MAG: TonB-dependent receptor [Bryobacterales bacterium]|nr:TonB-dependent receptor [Bryobacterales bacterium]
MSNIRGNTSSSVNGVALQDNNFLVDGIQNNENHQGYGVMVFPELEVIEQYRVATPVPDARFGRPGATINVAYKSGTNQYHGVVFEFLRNDRLDARNFFAAAKSPLRKNQFGATLGGPIGGKDARTFFFLSYEGQRSTQGVTSLSSVPTPLMRTGDFSELMARRTLIYDPLTTRANPAGAGLIRDPFANNVIPSNRFSTPGRNLLNFYPMPNLGGLATNRMAVDRPTASANQGTVKIDRELGAGSRGFVRYTQGNSDYVNPPNLLGPVATPYLGVQAPTIQLVPSYTHILDPRTVNQVRIGFSRQNLQSLSLNGGRNLAQEFGIANVNVSPFTTGLPVILVAGFPLMGDHTNNPVIIAMNNYEVSDNLDLTRGNHSIKIGFDVVRRHTNIFQAQTPRGTFNFTTNYTNNPAQPAGTGFGPADLLLGKPQTILVNGIDGTRGLRRTDWDAYIQDDWKVTRKLTINLGLRYDLSDGYPYHEVADRQAQFDLETGAPASVGTGKFSPRSGIENDRNNFGPRLGFAYQPGSHTVLRAAYGLYYSMKAFVLGNGLATNPPFFLNSLVTNDQANFAGARSLADGPHRTANRNAPGQNYTGLDPDFVLPMVNQWNLAIQQQLPGHQQLTVAYVGTKGTRLLQTINVNQPVPGDGPVDARRRFPRSATVRMQTTRGNSADHSLQVPATKRSSNSLHYQLAYTWSHAIDEVDPDGNTFFGTPINNLSLNRGNAGFDIRHQVRTTFGYDLPFGRGKAFLAGLHPWGNAVLGGWSINGGLSLYTGFNFDAVAAANTLNIGESVRANRLRDGNLPAGQRSIDRWFETEAFANPGFRQWGNGGRGILVGPGTKQLDFSIFKHFSVREGKQLQFRGEFFNLSNTPQFNNPGATVGGPTYGIVTSAGSEQTFQRAQRQIQVAVKFLF